MDCIFCKIAAGKIPAEIVHRDEEIIAFRDINPQAPVHILVIPLKHINTVKDLSSGSEELAGKMVLVANQLAKEENIAEKGFRLVFNCGENGGQEVYHIHLHMLGGRAMRWPPG